MSDYLVPQAVIDIVEKASQYKDGSRYAYIGRLEAIQRYIAVSLLSLGVKPAQETKPGGRVSRKR